MKITVLFLLLMTGCIASTPLSKDLQMYGCTATNTNLRVLAAENQNIAKGIWKESERESLDQIVQEDTIGLHACQLFDPNSGKHFIVVFYGTGYQGHSSLAVMGLNQAKP